MIFELPFDLIISTRLNTTLLAALLGFSPLILAEVSTLSLLVLSPLARVSRYTMYSLGGMILVWSLWALGTGFAFPADGLSYFLNSVSKVLAFAAAFTLFFGSPRMAAPATVQ
jgi:hypothetical protein